VVRSQKKNDTGERSAIIKTSPKMLREPVWQTREAFTNATEIGGKKIYRTRQRQSRVQVKKKKQATVGREKLGREEKGKQKRIDVVVRIKSG